jgi:hypothetical protein
VKDVVLKLRVISYGFPVSGSTRLKTRNKETTNEHKDIPFRAKAKLVEESKKGHTGDALALRGDEGRDKLR